MTRRAVRNAQRRLAAQLVVMLLATTFAPALMTMIPPGTALAAPAAQAAPTQYAGASSQLSGFDAASAVRRSP